MLGVLANLEGIDSYKAIETIVNDINSAAIGELEKQKYFKQIRIFVQFRKQFENQLTKAMESVSTFFREEDDFLYRRGEKRGIVRGIEKGKKIIVKNLLKSSSFSDKEIANIAEVTIDFVKDIRANKL